MGDPLQDAVEYISDTAQSEIPQLTRGVVGIVRRAQRNASEDMSDILNAWMRWGAFDSPDEARAWLEKPADNKTIRALDKLANDPKLSIETREVWARRRDNIRAYSWRYHNREAVRDLVDITMTDSLAGIKEYLYDGLENVVKKSAEYSAFTIQKQIGIASSFTLPSKRQIAGYIARHGIDTVLDNYSDDIRTTANNAIIEGMLSGQSTERIAKTISEVSGRSIYSAKRIVRTELSRSANDGMRIAMESAGLEKYEYRCVYDEKTCPVCGKLDGQIFELKDAKSGTNYPPMHPNCRCMHIAVLSDKIKKGITKAARDKDGKTIQIPSDMTFNQWKGIEEYIPKKPAEVDGMRTDMTDQLDAMKVQYNPVGEQGEAVDSIQAIKELGGGDLTRGSCSSIAFIYKLRRFGYNVDDFRGGKSQQFFATLDNIEKMAKVDGVQSWSWRDYNELVACHKAFEVMEEGREYYLAAGRHAAIIRKVEDKFEFLELQSNLSNGFKPLDDAKLMSRFGARYNNTWSQTVVLIDAETLNQPEILRLCGYINTKGNKVKRGVRGHIR